MTTLKIVDISAYFAHNPRSGGQARVFGFNQAMSKYATIEQFSFTPVIMRNKTFTYNKNYKEHIFFCPFYTKAVVLLKIFGYLNYDFIIPSVFKFIPFPRKLKKAVRNADLVQIEHPWLFKWVKKHTKKPIVLVEHNVELELQKGFFKQKAWRKCIVKYIRKTEEIAVKKADLIFAMSEEEKKKLSRMYEIKENKIKVVPNGTIIKDYDVSISKEHARKQLGLDQNQKIVLFVGAKHPPNNNAVKFIEILASKMHDVGFWIVGSVCKPGKKANLTYTGVVDDITLYNKAADLAINPVTEGSGSNLKMFGYLAAGLPVITTPKGNRGVDGKDKKDLVVVDLKKFPEKIRYLLKNKKTSEKLGMNAKIFAKKYDWEQIAKQALKEHYKISS